MNTDTLVTLRQPGEFAGRSSSADADFVMVYFLTEVLCVRRTATLLVVILDLRESLEGFFY